MLRILEVLGLLSSFLHRYDPRADDRLQCERPRSHVFSFNHVMSLCSDSGEAVLLPVPTLRTFLRLTSDVCAIHPANEKYNVKLLLLVRNRAICVNEH